MAKLDNFQNDRRYYKGIKIRDDVTMACFRQISHTEFYFMTKLYNELAIDWYQLLTPVEEYEEEANLYHQIFEEKQRS